MQETRSQSSDSGPNVNKSPRKRRRTFPPKEKSKKQLPELGRQFDPTMKLVTQRTTTKATRTPCFSQSSRAKHSGVAEELLWRAHHPLNHPLPRSPRLKLPFARKIVSASATMTIGRGFRSV